MNLAKLLPPSSSRALERDRLLNKLQEWDEKKLIIIHGQAGQGKSMLAATYTQSLATPAAWYTLDQEDADPAVFLAGLAQALARIWPDQTFRLPRIPQNDLSAPRDAAALHRWINQTFSSLHQPGLIVLDDYHAIPSPNEFDPVLRTLIDATPSHIRFIIISRTQPSLEVARLRARRTLGVLTGQDLAFNDREAHDLFCDIFGMPLDRTESTRINRRAEGWPAGLVLTHEYLAQSSPQSSSGILGADCADKLQPPVFEYLAQEVFSLLPPDLQDFLLRTSITNWLPLRLIQQLTGLPLTAASGKSSVRSVVQELQNRNLFISVADDAAVVRYHALFHEFLLKKLHAETKPAVVQKLFTTAIRYFEQADDPVRAVDLCFAAGQVEKAILQIEACGQDVLARGQVQTLLRWISALPAEEQDRPWFLFFRANALRFSAPHEALLLLDRARTGFRTERKASRRSLGTDRLPLRDHRGMLPLRRRFPAHGTDCPAGAGAPEANQPACLRRHAPGCCSPWAWPGSSSASSKRPRSPSRRRRTFFQNRTTRSPALPAFSTLRRARSTRVIFAWPGRRCAKASKPMPPSPMTRQAMAHCC